MEKTSKIKVLSNSRKIPKVLSDANDQEILYHWQDIERELGKELIQVLKEPTPALARYRMVMLKQFETIVEENEEEIIILTMEISIEPG